MTATAKTAPGLDMLRQPFPPSAIGKLPKGLDKSKPKARCGVKGCAGWHEPAQTHLDYVGHAAATDRLLDVDPQWTWEPAGTDEHGQPVLLRNQQGHPIGLWIRLTVAGVTRLGYGSCEPAKTEAVKELIGDAIRNAAMRFGVGLDLWHKGDLHADVPPPPPTTPATDATSTATDATSTATPPPSVPAEAPFDPITPQQLAHLKWGFQRLPEDVRINFATHVLTKYDVVSSAELTTRDAAEAIESMDSLLAATNVDAEAGDAA